MATVEELQAEVAKLTQQVQGLAAERNASRQEANAWKRLGEQLEPGSIVLDANGLPTGWAQPAGAGGANAGGGNGAGSNGHPFSGLADPSAVDQWLQAQVNALNAKQGFVTNQQLQQLIQKAQSATFQMTRDHYLLWRGVDQMTTNEKYKALADPASDLSKSVAKVLQDRGWGKPLSDSWKSFATDWQYAQVDQARPHAALEWAVERAVLDQAQAAQAGQAAVVSGQAAQGAAQLGGGAGTGGAPAGAGGSKVQELVNQNAPVGQVMDALDQAAATQ